MRIGNFTFEGNVFLAPMAGVTDQAFRKICRAYGCSMVCSEMVSAKGLFYKDKKTEQLLRAAEDETPYTVQIFGSDAKIMAQVAPVAASYGDILDINMGCPTPKIVNNGDGSALMKDPRKAGEIMRAVSDSTDKPVTVKFRTGWDKNCINAVEFAKIMEQNGAAAVALHGRTREQFYSGAADWEMIRSVKGAVDIPVIGNGDIFSVQDAVRMMEETGCDGVMIGRGAQGNPFIFRQLAEYQATGKITFYPTEADKISQALHHTRMLVENKGESRGIKEARKHIAWYLKGIPNGAKAKGAVFQATNLKQMEHILLEFIQQYQ